MDNELADSCAISALDGASLDATHSHILSFGQSVDDPSNGHHTNVSCSVQLDNLKVILVEEFLDEVDVEGSTPLVADSNNVGLVVSGL